VTDSPEGLLALPLGEFVARVASTDQPVPAGGSVSALVGASSAALLALACGVLVKHHGEEMEPLRQRAVALQARLLALLEEDAAAYHAFLESKRDPVAIGRMSEVPLEIAAACAEAVALSGEVTQRIRGAVAADVGAAHRLAAAAREAVLDLADENVRAQRDPAAREALQLRIAQLRG
jgi:formiminotetrahydrofolate cyclodeaminase